MLNHALFLWRPHSGCWGWAQPLSALAAPLPALAPGPGVHEVAGPMAPPRPVPSCPPPSRRPQACQSPFVNTSLLCLLIPLTRPLACLGPLLAGPPQDTPPGSWSPELASGPWQARTRLPPSTPLTLTPGLRPGWAAPPRAGSPYSWLDSGPWLGSLPAPGSPGAAPHLSPRTAPLGRLCPECLTQDPGLRLVGRDGVFKLGLQGLQLCGHGADGGLGAQQAAWGQGAAPGGGSRPSAQAPAGSCVPSWASWMVHPGRRGRPAAPADQVLGPEGSQR